MNRSGRTRLCSAPRWCAWVLGALTLTGSVAACGGSTSRSAGPATVDVTLSNFKIDAPTRVHAGRDRFVIAGLGPTMHELNIARSDLMPDQLPLAADGTVDDSSPHADFTHIAEAEGIDIGQKKSLTVELSPGHYVLYCNMDGHYMAGMSARLTVVP